MCSCEPVYTMPSHLACPHCGAAPNRQCCPNCGYKHETYEEEFFTPVNLWKEIEEMEQRAEDEYYAALAWPHITFAAERSSR